MLKSLGASLYVPANHKDLARIANGEKLPDARSLISVSPQPGFQHQFSELDTLGTDRPESRCRFR